MNLLLINIFLALLWASLQQFRPTDVVGGFLLGYGLLWICQPWLGEDAAPYLHRLPRFVGFVLYYLGELAAATFDVIKTVFRDQSTLKPGIIAFPLEARTDLEIVLLNNLLSLTPGTLGVDLSPDRSTLYIHVIDVPDADATKQRIKNGLERRLLEVLR